jgi:hypothetical protein
MKITKAKLKQLIKEELQVSEAAQYEGGPEVDLDDAIGMLKEHPLVLKSVVESAIKVVEAANAQEDETGTLFHIINRLHEALEKLNDDSGYIDF